MDDLADIPDEKIPRHIAIIMDGNGRWAVQRGLQRVRGHQQGAKVVKQLVTHCSELRRQHGGPDYLTLYSFSLENWKRPADEVMFLMQMYIDYLRDERPTMMEQNIRSIRSAGSTIFPIWCWINRTSPWPKPPTTPA